MQQPHEADQRLQSTKLWKNIQRPIQLCGSFPSKTTSPQPGKSVTTCSVDLLIFAENPTVLEKSLFGAKRELFKLCHLQIKYRSQGIVELPYRGDHASSMEISLEIYAYLGIQYLMIAAGSPSNINPLLKSVHRGKNIQSQESSLEEVQYFPLLHTTKNDFRYPNHTIQKTLEKQM